MNRFNTDMADERVDEYKVINNMSSIDGIKVEQEEYDEFKITKVDVLDENGQKAIEKKIGKYITIDIENVKYLEDEECIIKKIEECIGELILEKQSVMVVGLGNMYVTPDALGAKVVKNIDVTRHILKLSKDSLPSNTREVSAFCPGVMGNTGIQTQEIVVAVANNVKPKYIIVIDSLMSKSIDRVGCSIQISNTGLSPGSGITGINNCIDEESTGAKVISIGVPMVVDMATITNEALSKINNETEENHERYYEIAQILNTKNYIVTPKDIDELIEVTSNIISSSINNIM